MGKVGRNDKCPCQSGRKYKHCCGRTASVSQPRPLSQEEASQITLLSRAEPIIKKALGRKAATHEIGVFFFFSTAAGDAWLLELTDCDCIQLAKDGQRLELEIEEDPETIEVNWTHTFTVTKKVLELTAYADRNVVQLPDAPAREINAALRRIRKRLTPEQLRNVHVHSPDTAIAQE